MTSIGITLFPSNIFLNFTPTIESGRKIIVGLLGMTIDYNCTVFGELLQNLDDVIIMINLV